MKLVMFKQQHSSLKVFATAALLLSGTGMLVNPIAATAAPQATQRIAQSTMTAEMWYKQGRAKRDEEDYKGAIEDYTQAIKLQPDNPGFYAQRGSAQFALGEGQRAIADYTQALKYVSNDIAKAANMNMRAEAYDMLGDSKSAIADYQKATDLFQKSNKPEQAQKSSESLKILQAEIATQSKMTAEMWHQKGKDLHGSDNAEGAEGDFSLEASLVAIGYFNRAIKLKTNYAEAYSLRGERFAFLKNYPRAIADLNQALKLNPSDTGAYYVRAYAHQQSNNTQGAIADLQQAANLYKKMGNADRYESYMSMVEDCKAGSCELELGY
jgi:tetratricopeptide (TPR) repeat protein